MDGSDGEEKFGLDHVSILNPVGETMRPKNSTEAPRKGVVDGLSDFTNLLSNTLGSFDSNIHSLQDSYASTLSLIQSMKIQMDAQATKIKLLEEETEDQRDKIEQALHNVVKIEKNVDSQLSESTKQLHKEMVHQRTTTKMDINSLRGSFQT
jgi:septal ring factor EnvC (AmiA/AmiB activator)